MTKFDHVAKLEKQITELSDALAHLGRGTSIRDLLKIIKQPGYTTPAEFRFFMAMLAGISSNVATISTMTRDLADAAGAVLQKQSA